MFSSLTENCELTAKQERTGNQLEQFHLGYQECMSETMQFLVESEGFFSGDSLCVRLMNHLTKHCEKILTSKSYSFFTVWYIPNTTLLFLALESHSHTKE